MPGAIIRIDQVRPGPVTSSGTAGISREDLWVGSVVNLVSTLSGNSDQQWTLLDKPVGSTATLATATAVTSTFTPDLPGSYRVGLTTNSGVQGQTRIAAVTRDAAGVSVFRGWRVPAFKEKGSEANFSGNTTGWKAALEKIINALAPPPVAVAALNIDWRLGDDFYKTLANGASVITFSNPTEGQTICLELTGSGTSTVTWPTMKTPGGTPIVVTPGGTDWITIKYRGGIFYAVPAQDFG